jgi:hypothetical protein
MKTLRIRACHNERLDIHHGVIPAFVGSPRRVLWWWNKKPVVFTGDFFFPLCAVKSWVTVK